MYIDTTVVYLLSSLISHDKCRDVAVRPVSTTVVIMVLFYLIRTYASVTRSWLVPYTHCLIILLIINQCTSTTRAKYATCVSPINV